MPGVLARPRSSADFGLREITGRMGALRRKQRHSSGYSVPSAANWLMLPRTAGAREESGGPTVNGPVERAGHPRRLAVEPGKPSEPLGTGAIPFRRPAVARSRSRRLCPRSSPSGRGSSGAPCPPPLTPWEIASRLVPLLDVLRPPILLPVRSCSEGLTCRGGQRSWATPLRRMPTPPRRCSQRRRREHPTWELLKGPRLFCTAVLVTLR